MSEIVQLALGAIETFRQAYAKTQANQQECARLHSHAKSTLDAIRRECKDNIPVDLERRLKRLVQTLSDLTSSITELSKSPLIKRMWNRDLISGKIQGAYREIDSAVKELQLGIFIDTYRMQKENEDARRSDEKKAREDFEHLLRNESDLIGELRAHRVQMEEAVLCFREHLERSKSVAERKLLEKGLHTVQRYSGPVDRATTKHRIMSLDVIIHYGERLGVGGYASVYKADWRGTKVAVKMLHKGISTNSFEHELKAWKDLKHPHILQFFGACTMSDPPFLVCALKEADSIKYLRKYPDADRVKLLHEAALGLDFLHCNNIVHGDLKGNNILVDKLGQACLADFGLSKMIVNSKTVSGSGPGAKGAVRWMSPETMTYGSTNKRSDIYSFAMTMYEVFTGTPPFAHTPDSILLQVICDRATRPPRPDIHEAPGLDDEIWHLMKQSWAPDPKARPVASYIASNLQRSGEEPYGHKSTPRLMKSASSQTLSEGIPSPGKLDTTNIKRPAPVLRGQTYSGLAEPVLSRPIISATQSSGTAVSSRGNAAHIDDKQHKPAIYAASSQMYHGSPQSVLSRSAPMQIPGHTVKESSASSYSWGRTSHEWTTAPHRILHTAHSQTFPSTTQPSVSYVRPRLTSPTSSTAIPGSLKDVHGHVESGAPRPSLRTASSQPSAFVTSPEVSTSALVHQSSTMSATHSALVHGSASVETQYHGFLQTLQSSGPPSVPLNPPRVPSRAVHVSLPSSPATAPACSVIPEIPKSLASSKSVRRVRAGFWNKRGDHLVEKGGQSKTMLYIVRAPRELSYPKELASYPEPNTGWRDHHGQIIKYDPSVPDHPTARPYTSFVTYTYA